jgi:exopolysaccharide biosynthesis predicted pyruvyltransferase EpsI
MNLETNLFQILSSTLGSCRNVGLVMFPYHTNVGDSAIWAGTVCALEKLQIKIRYACSHVTYNPKHLAKAHPDGPILILGGGNFGDVYRSEATLRNRLIVDFYERKIIQLPQSIWFKNEKSIEGMNSILSKHADFTLLVRDHKSFEFANKHFPRSHIKLCPDMAFALNSKIHKLNPNVSNIKYEVLCILRIDGESIGNRELLTNQLPANRFQIEDWKCDSENYRNTWGRMDQFLWKLSNFVILMATKKHGGQIPMPLIVLAKNHMAQIRTKYGILQLDSGKIILTDRLHVAILSLISGKRVYLMDNCYNKNKNFYFTWLDNNPLISFVEKLENLKIA